MAMLSCRGVFVVSWLLVLLLIWVPAASAVPAKLVDSLATLESFESKVLKLANGKKITTGESPAALKALRGYRSDLGARVARMAAQDKENRASEEVVRAQNDAANHVKKEKIVGDSHMVESAQRTMSLGPNGARPVVTAHGVKQKYDPITNPKQLGTLKQLLPKSNANDLPQVAMSKGANNLRTSSQYAGIFKHT